MNQHAQHTLARAMQLWHEDSLSNDPRLAWVGADLRFVAEILQELQEFGSISEEAFSRLAGLVPPKGQRGSLAGFAIYDCGSNVNLINALCDAQDVATDLLESIQKQSLVR